MSGKSHTKIVSRLIAFTSLHRLFCFKLTFLSEFVIKYLKTSSFFWIFLCRNSSLTKTTDSYSFLCCCWRKKLVSQNRKLLLSMKTLLLLLTKSCNARKFCFSVCFLSFFRFRFLTYWDHYRKFARFDSLKTIKKY